MAEELELTRDLLMEAGGWKEMKAAREMHRSGLVMEAGYEGGVLRGVVRIGGKPRRVRMEVLSPAHMENKCSCRAAQREGRVCAHAIAVGLEVIEPAAAASEGGGEREKEGPEDRWPRVTEEAVEGARAVRCRVMLPLRVQPSWERGQLMVGIGVSEDGEGEALLNTFGKDRVLFVGERDATLLQTLKRLFPGEAPGVMTLGRAGFLTLLEGLAGHPRVHFGKREAAVVSWRAARPALRVKGHRVTVEWPPEAIPLVDGGRAWVSAGRAFHPVAPGLPEAWRDLPGPGLTLNAAEAGGVLRALGEWFEVDEAALAGLPQPAVPRVEVRLEGSLNHLEAAMTFHYGGSSRVAGEAAAEVLEGDDGRAVARSPELERAAMDALRQEGFEGPGRRGVFVLRDKQAILRFHAHGLARLDPDWTVRMGERFAHAAANVVPVKPVLDIRSSGEDWLAVGAGYRTGDGRDVPAREIRRLVESGRVDRPLRNGKIAVIDPGQVEEVWETLADCDPSQESPGVFWIDPRQAVYLKEAARDLGVATGQDPEKRAAGEAEFCEKLGPLDSVLRPYQREGAAWMWRLAELGMGGVLADDMGLGKTVQALAFLKARGGQSLVVCPTSLIENWLAEAERFVPELKAVAIHGGHRGEQHAASREADLVVTSYALLRLDAKHYHGRRFEAVVLDEAQQIKNPEAQVAKAAFRLEARHRFALTGTPIENSVRDLWSIMHFVMPGYLGRRREFLERFEKPLARGEAPELQRRLTRRLKPVVRRRLKREVANDLPERIEQVRYCDLSPGQRKVYEAILRESRALVDEAEGGRKRMLALTALLRLRQACCDLRLLDLPGVEDREASAKMEELDGLLAEAVAGGHRVLVFSQFVRMLQAIVPVLSERGHAYCYLDGQTRRRGEVVARFQNSPEIPVFLISLKAGGVGLNLTGADTVIHIDPWWNPAVEAQATDRAHRIGQRRVVTSYKLIARDTVEEKILALQERKRQLFEATLDAEPPPAATSLSDSEIFELFG